MPPAVTADDFFEGPKQCLFGRWLAEADPKIRAAIEEAVARGATANRVSKVLTDRGVLRITPNPVRYHLRGECSCPKTCPPRISPRRGGS